MAVIIYEGYIDPDVVPLSLDYQPKIIRQEDKSGPEVEYTVTVFVGRIRVTAETENADIPMATDLFFPAWDVARSFVEAVGYIRAIPYTVTLNRVILPSGETRNYAFGDRSLAATHGFTDEDAEAISDITLTDLKCGLALSDLLMTLGRAHYSPIACGRVADSIARLIAPDEKRSVQWEMLRRALRVDEAFVRSLSDVSKGSRHGDREPVDAETNSVTAHRAWTLFGRYLRYRLSGELDPKQYPALAG